MIPSSACSLRPTNKLVMIQFCPSPWSSPSIRRPLRLTPASITSRNNPLSNPTSKTWSTKRVLSSNKPLSPPASRYWSNTINCCSLAATSCRLAQHGSKLVLADIYRLIEVTELVDLLWSVSGSGAGRVATVVATAEPTRGCQKDSKWPWAYWRVEQNVAGLRVGTVCHGLLEEGVEGGTARYTIRALIQ